METPDMKAYAIRVGKIADHFTYEHVLLRAAEEYAEASAALLRYRRALAIKDGDPDEKYLALASELADCQVMVDQILKKEPTIYAAIRSEYMRKIDRTIKRYKIGEKE